MGPGWNLSLVVEFVALTKEESLVGRKLIVSGCELSHAGICHHTNKNGKKVRVKKNHAYKNDKRDMHN